MFFRHTDNTLANLMLWSRMQTKFTPDIAELELQQFCLLFVCDDLMQGCKNYPLIEDSVSEGRAFTRDLFQFFRKDTDGTAIPLGTGRRGMAARNPADVCRIKGELHNVRPSSMMKLDTHMMNGIKYRRRRIEVLYPYRDHAIVKIGSEDTLPNIPGIITTKNELGIRHFVSNEMVCSLEAWMYVGCHSYWDDLIDGGFAFSKQPIRQDNKRPWLDKYYQFNKRLNEDR